MGICLVFNWGFIERISTNGTGVCTNVVPRPHRHCTPFFDFKASALFGLFASLFGACCFLCWFRFLWHVLVRMIRDCAQCIIMYLSLISADYPLNEEHSSSNIRIFFIIAPPSMHHLLVAHIITEHQQATSRPTSKGKQAENLERWPWEEPSPSSPCQFYRIPISSHRHEKEKEAGQSECAPCHRIVRCWSTRKREFRQQQLTCWQDNRTPLQQTRTSWYSLAHICSPNFLSTFWR